MAAAGFIPLLVFLLCSLPSSEGMGFAETLTMNELRQERGPSDPSGVNHNLRTLLAPHHMNTSITRNWTLEFHRDSVESEVYEDTQCNVEQTNVLFEGNLVNTTTILLSAHGPNGDVTDDDGFAYLITVIEDLLDSRAAWVGENGKTQAFLRVHTGTQETQDVQYGNGQTITCNKTDNPCYYKQTELGHPDNVTVSRCRDIKYNEGSAILHQCDDIVGLFPPMPEPPELLLSRAASEVTVSHKTNATKGEMVEWPVNGECSVTNCEDSDKACTFSVALDPDQETLESVVALFNEDGYVTNTFVLSMTVYKISTQRLTTDALHVTWSNGDPAIYYVTVNSSPPKELTVNCTIADLCQTYFTSLNLDNDDVVEVKVRKEYETVSDSMSISDTPKSFQLTKLTRMIDDEVSTVVEIDADCVISNTIVLVRSRTEPTGQTDDVQYWDGTLTRVTDDYSPKFDFDFMDQEGTFDFLVVVYKDQTKAEVECAGSATVELKDIEVQVDEVGSTGGYVRVSTNSTEALIVNDEEVGVCNQTQPCYQPAPTPPTPTRTPTGTPTPTPTPTSVCTKQNSTLLCQELVPTSTNEMTGSTQLELNMGTDEELEITSKYSENTSTVELYVADFDQVQVCEDTASPCVLQANFSDNFILVVTGIGAKGEVVESATFSFLVYQIETQRLTEDSLHVSWSNAPPAIYEVIVSSARLLPPLPLLATTSLTVNCTDDPCHTFITSFTLGNNIEVHVKQKEENMTVTNTMDITDTQKSLTILKLTTMIDDEVSTVVEIDADDELLSDTIVLVRSRTKPTGQTDDVQYWDGNLTKVTGGYSAMFDLDLMDQEGKFDFLVVVYNETEVECAGSATVELDKVYVDLVGSSGEVLRVSTTLDEDIVVNQDVCSDDPCYVPAPPPPHTTTVCTTNSTTEASLILCQEAMPTPATGMTGSPQLELLRDDNETITVSSTDYDANTSRVELYVDGQVKVCNNTDEPCTMEGASVFPYNFNVVVTCAGEDGQVLESTTIPFQDLNVTTMQISKEILEVRWSSLEPEQYTATLTLESLKLTASHIKDNTGQDMAPPFSLRSPVTQGQYSPLTLKDVRGQEVAPSQVSCGQDIGVCLAHFTDLESGSYSVSVHKEVNDTTSVATTTNMAPEFEEPPTKHIIKLSSVTMQETQVSLESPLDAEMLSVEMSVKRIDGYEVSLEGEVVGSKLTTYRFTHTEQLLSAGSTRLLLLARDDIDKVKNIGKAELDLYDQSSTVFWVGGAALNCSASLRVVDADIDLAGHKKECISESPICYYLEVGDSERVEACHQLKDSLNDEHTVEQCTQVISEYGEFENLLSVILDGGDVKVSVVSGWTGILEVLAYDPEDQSRVYSDTKQACEVQSDNQTCRQPLLTRDAQRMKVLVVGTNSNGIVEGSALRILSRPEPSSNTDVIVWSVFGSVLGVAVIAFIVIVIVKKRQSYRHLSNSNEGKNNAGFKSDVDNDLNPAIPLTQRPSDTTQQMNTSAQSPNQHTRSPNPQPRPINAYQEPYQKTTNLHNEPQRANQPPPAAYRKPPITRPRPNPNQYPPRPYPKPITKPQPQAQAWNARGQVTSPTQPIPKPAPVAYNEWGARNLGGSVAPQPPNTMVAYNEWGARKLGGSVAPQPPNTTRDEDRPRY